MYISGLETMGKMSMKTTLGLKSVYDLVACFIFSATVKSISWKCKIMGSIIENTYSSVLF